MSVDAGKEAAKVLDQAGWSPMVWGSEPELYGPFHHFRVGLVLRTLRQLLPRGRILDAGCGVGSISMALGRLGYGVAGTDISESFCKHASFRARKEVPGKQVSLVRGDITRLPFRSSAFDGLVCGEVLEHLENDRAALAEFARVLRPGGVFVITVPVRRELWSASDAWAGHLRRYDRSDLCRLITQSGLVVHEVVPYGCPFGNLYQRLVTKRIAMASTRMEKKDKYSVFKRFGRHRVVVRLIAAALDLDRVLRIESRACGLAVAGRKPAAMS